MESRLGRLNNCGRHVGKCHGTAATSKISHREVNRDLTIVYGE
jgi:hypothetical protein